MRPVLLLPLLALAACSIEPPSGPSPRPAPTPAPPPAACSLPFSGAYELSISSARASVTTST